MNKKAQEATEYLIILAVVIIIIALIVIGVMGGLSSFHNDFSNFCQNNSLGDYGGNKKLAIFSSDYYKVKCGKIVYNVRVNYSSNDWGELSDTGNFDLIK